MATEKGGFDCDFVEPPPKYLECPICSLTLRDPHVTSCCGSHFCHPCVQQIQRDGKPCPDPECNDPSFTVFLHKGVMREVNALLVRCPQKELGCQWVGKLGELQQHLNPGAGVKDGGGCKYVEVECVYKCGERFQHDTIRKHELELCPNRPLEVQLSSMTKKLTAALAENYSLKEEIAQMREKQEQEIGKLAAALQVLKLEMEDENKSLKKKLEQLEQAQDKQKETTAQECQSLADQLKQTIEAENEAMKEAMKKELAQLKQAQDQLKISTDQDHHSLSQQVNQLKQNQQSAKAAIVENELQVIKQDVRALKVKQDGFEGKCTFLESRLTPVPPFYFTMVDFEWWKKEGLVWRSDPFYSHPGGYKMQGEVYPGGCNSGMETHVTVYVRLMRGEYDDKLHWPFQGKVTFQIYNRNSNAWEFEKIISFHDAPALYSVRPSADSISNRGLGYHQFVAHRELPVVGNLVRFRVVKVEV